jgi:hypothetical protein
LLALIIEALHYAVACWVAASVATYPLVAADTYVLTNVVDSGAVMTMDAGALVGAGLCAGAKNYSDYEGRQKPIVHDADFPMVVVLAMVCLQAHEKPASRRAS